MSYDIWMEGPDGNTLGKSLNYTSNVSGVFYDHMTGGLHAIKNMPGYEALPIIMRFWDNLHETKMKMWQSDAVGEPKLTQKYDPKNGWGSLIGAMLFLAQFQSEVIKYPYATVRLSA